MITANAAKIIAEINWRNKESDRKFSVNQIILRKSICSKTSVVIGNFSFEDNEYITSKYCYGLQKFMVDEITNWLVPLGYTVTAQKDCFCTSEEKYRVKISW